VLRHRARKDGAIGGAGPPQDIFRVRPPFGDSLWADGKIADFQCYRRLGEYLSTKETADPGATTTPFGRNLFDRNGHDLPKQEEFFAARHSPFTR
jgi:hypothetical protein